jgi:hypothetical protein
LKNTIDFVRGNKDLVEQATKKYEDAKAAFDKILTEIAKRPERVMPKMPTYSKVLRK